MNKHELPSPRSMKLGTVFWCKWMDDWKGGFHRVKSVSAQGATTSEPVRGLHQQARTFKSREACPHSEDGCLAPHDGRGFHTG